MEEDKMKTRRIGIDCRLSGIKHAGIGRYIQNLIIRIISKNKQTNWVFFFSNKSQFRKFEEAYLKLHNQKKLPDKLEIIFTPIKHYSIAEQLKLPKIFKDANLDLLHVPHFNIPILYNQKIMITIHDLLWHEQKGISVTTLNPLKYLLKYQAYKFISKQAVHKACRIITPSETIKKVLFKYYPLVKSKISVVHEGIDENFSKHFAIKKNRKDSKQLIYTGSLYPHKNLILVLKALKKLSNIKLKLVGSRNVFQTRLLNTAKKLGVFNQVKVAGFLSDQKLIKEYKNSLAFVQPSLSEGFGLPALEAMSVGLPVLASNIAIFKEIYRDIPIYFDPHNVDSLVRAINLSLTKDLSSKLREGKKLCENYSWDDMALKFNKIYQAESL